jgi:uncharacterized protein
MKWDGFRSSSNVEDRRGAAGGGGGGPRIGGGRLGLGGIVVVLIISYLTGLNPMTLIGGYEAVTGGGETTVSAPAGKTGEPQDRIGQFVAKVLGATEDTWSEIFREQVNGGYPAPRLVVFDGVTRSACGQAQSAMGPFYCPTDKTVYLDTAFFDEMRTRFKACPAGSATCEFAQAYVVAHEVGHHVQNVLGILPKVQQARARLSEADSNALSVRTELQADCFAGVWANQTQQRIDFIQDGDIPAALQTAAAIGDDMLQRRSQGYVVPDSFTHGSSDQRQRWFTKGLKSGQLSQCDTFNAPSL